MTQIRARNSREARRRLHRGGAAASWPASSSKRFSDPTQGPVGPLASRRSRELAGTTLAAPPENYAFDDTWCTVRPGRRAPDHEGAKLLNPGVETLHQPEPIIMSCTAKAPSYALRSRLGADYEVMHQPGGRADAPGHRGSRSQDARRGLVGPSRLQRTRAGARERRAVPAGHRPAPNCGNGRLRAGPHRRQQPGGRLKRPPVGPINGERSAPAAERRRGRANIWPAVPGEGLERRPQARTPMRQTAGLAHRRRRRRWRQVAVRRRGTRFCGDTRPGHWRPDGPVETRGRRPAVRPRHQRRAELHARYCRAVGAPGRRGRA